MSYRIDGEELKRWLKDRLVPDSKDFPVQQKIRTAPALLPDVNVFGKSLLAHHFRQNKDRTFVDWQAGYEAGLAAAKRGEDPIPFIAKEIKLMEDKVRRMLSGYRAHPLDEINTIAQIMALGAGIMYPSLEYEDGLVRYDGRVIMGVGREMIHSAYGNTMPVRQSFDALRTPRVNVTVKLPDDWLKIYAPHVGDEDAERVLDHFVTSTKNLKPLYTCLYTGPRKRHKKIRNFGARIQMNQAMLAKVEDIIFTSESPIRDLYLQLVPLVMGAIEFRQTIGNHAVQVGKIRGVTQEKLLAWLEEQKAYVEQRSG